jgi:hypothetical protein
MTAINHQIADALVTALKAAGFTEAERKPIPYVVREEAATRKCVVICRNNQYPDGKRSNLDEVVELAICIQQAVDPTSNTEVDDLLDDVSTLVGLWKQNGALRHTLLAGACFHEGPEHPTGNIYEPQQLLELRMFTSVTVVRYLLDE